MPAVEAEDPGITLQGPQVLVVVVLVVCKLPVRAAPPILEAVEEVGPPPEAQEDPVL
jgi:hypothetical protein